MYVQRKSVDHQLVLVSLKKVTQMGVDHSGGYVNVVRERRRNNLASKLFI